MADDILQEVPESEIPKVLEEMKKEWPKHFLLHQYISVMEDKKNCESKLHQVLYRYGNLDEGVYVMYTEFPIGLQTRPIYFIYTKFEDVSTIESVIKKTTRIPWDTKNILFEISLEKFTPTIMKCIGNGEKKYLAERFILMYLLPEEDLHEKEIPEEVYLDFLHDSHVPEVDKCWKYRGPESEKYLGLQLKNNFGLGVFRKSDNKLLSFALSHHNRGIFTLITVPGFRGKGYAEIIVLNMIKEIRQQDKIPFCTIDSDNIPSLKLFTKIGFKEFGNIDYIFNQT